MISRETNLCMFHYYYYLKAMIGIMSFLCEAKIPGSVPALKGLVKPYSGQVMAPFEGTPLFPESDLSCIFEGLCNGS